MDKDKKKGKMGEMMEKKGNRERSKEGNVAFRCSSEAQTSESRHLIPL